MDAHSGTASSAQGPLAQSSSPIGPKSNVTDEAVSGAGRCDGSKVHFELTPGILVADKRDQHLSITCGCKACVDAVPKKNKRPRMGPPKWLKHCGAATPPPAWKQSIKVDGAFSLRGKPLPLKSWAEINGSVLVHTPSGADRGTRLERTATSQPQNQQVPVGPQPTKGSGSGAGVPKDGMKAKKSGGRKEVHAGTDAASPMVWNLENPLGEAGSLATAAAAVLTMRVVPGSIVRRRDSGQLGWVQHLLPHQVEAADADTHVGASLANVQVVPVVRGCDMAQGDAASPEQLFLLDTRPAPRPELPGAAAAGAGGGGTGGHVGRAQPFNSKVGEATAPQRGAAQRTRDSGEMWALEEVVEVLKDVNVPASNECYQVRVKFVTNMQGAVEVHTAVAETGWRTDSPATAAMDDDWVTMPVPGDAGAKGSVEVQQRARADGVL
ncbi:hypothetical protein TSOC_009488 [Tetrabaena socialis]|uniref:Uncharacterized protein n=1 Tax=Tetrabaena socialis TaxID=47790 RepID=A0A2J7ZVS9_9CHLO|nr:hypothetical protein TSOC_009488 [Tetrabaena socialis]|eukprot:PNH04348.1 hypothetical protein TSOC_009488 [Tetrabaena socialis]